MLRLNQQNTQRTYCGDRNRGCGSSLTETDLDAGFCTQCHEPLTVPEFPLEHALLLSLSEAQSASNRLGKVAA